MATVANGFRLCRAQFDLLLQSPKVSDHASEVSIEQWRDELSRLLIWAGNIGAQQTRQSSLDYRLRDASHIRDQVINLLHGMQELLTDLSSLLEDEERGIHNDSPLEDDMSDFGHRTEIQQIYDEIVESITQLYQMSMAIRTPAKHDRLVGIRKIDAEPFRHWALQHASQKFPHADETALERMSAAMTQQRAILKYRERHHTKLSQGIEQNDDNATILSETAVSKSFTEAQDENDNASTGISETSYGGTLLDGADGQTSKIPPMPKAGADQQPFECSLCFYIITVRDRKSWARHVFRDLLPYVCIFQDCPTPNKLYESRRQWFHHIQHTHKFATESNDVYTCPICKETSIPASRFQQHMGRHLEELSLFFVPKQGEEELEFDTSGDDANSSKDSEEEVQKEDGMPLESQLNSISLVQGLMKFTSLENSKNMKTSPCARWTRIDRRLVNPEALALGNERFVERHDHVIVLRLLNHKQIQEYARRTQEIRSKHGRIEARLQEFEASSDHIADWRRSNPAGFSYITPREQFNVDYPVRAKDPSEVRDMPSKGYLNTNSRRAVSQDRNEPKD